MLTRATSPGESEGRLGRRPQKLKEREELVAKDADSKRSADLSSQIRADIREIKAKIDELTKIQRKEAKRARVQPLRQRASRTAAPYDALTSVGARERRQGPAAGAENAG